MSSEMVISSHTTSFGDKEGHKIALESNFKNFVKYVGNSDVKGYGEILLIKPNQK